MERKTNVNAEDGKPDIIITRDFDLPVHLLFKAYTEPDLVAQWMGTKVVKLENKAQGVYAFETSDGQGNILFKAHGIIHEVVTNQKIVRTFEMANAGFDVQLEFLEFEALTPETSKLRMQTIFRSEAHRAKQLKMPFAYGINMAHNRLQEIIKKLQ